MTYKNLDDYGYDEVIYTGQFRNQKREGLGEMKWRNGKDYFKGLFHNDLRVYGLMKMADGSEYEGEWKNDVFHGKGKLKFK